MSTATPTATPAQNARQTVTQLLDGAIERARQGEILLTAGDIGGSRVALDSAMDIVDVLREALDTDAGGNLALMLDYLYAYSSLRLLEGREHGESTPITEAIGLLDRVASGFRELADAELLAA